MSAPEGMTPDKLRSIADWLDIFDKLAEVVIIERPKPETTKALAAVRGKEVQVELRRWADEIEPLDHSPSEPT